MKYCYKCNTKKNLADFSTNKKKSDGLNAECKECQKAYFREYYKNNKQKHIKAVNKCSTDLCQCGNKKRKSNKQCFVCSDKTRNDKRTARYESKTNRNNQFLPTSRINSNKLCKKCSNLKSKHATVCYRCFNENPHKQHSVKKVHCCPTCGEKKDKDSIRCRRCHNKVSVVHVQPLNDSDKAARIADLRNQGLNYLQIAQELGINKSVVAYHCSDRIRANHQKRTKEYRGLRDWKDNMCRRIYDFRGSGRQTNGRIYTKSNWEYSLKHRIYGFHKTKGEKRVDKTFNFTVDDILAKFGETPECYLTGRQLDFKDPSSYELDHIIPRSKGGPNTLDNMGIVCPEANWAKRNMPLDDFIVMCKEIAHKHK